MHEKTADWGSQMRWESRESTTLRGEELRQCPHAESRDSRQHSVMASVTRMEKCVLIPATPFHPTREIRGPAAGKNDHGPGKASGNLTFEANLVPK